MARPRHARVLLSLDVSALSHLTRCILSLFIVSHHYCWVLLFEVNWSLSIKGEKLQAAAYWGVGWLEHSARDRLLYLGSSQHGTRMVGEGPANQTNTQHSAYTAHLLRTLSHHREGMFTNIHRNTQSTKLPRALLLGLILGSP